jgi:RNA polymerase sigma-70 factor (ECF subfamily)
VQQSASSAPSRPTLAELYRDHSGFVWRVVRRFGIDDAAAEDVVHEIFLVARRKLPEYEGRGAPTSWLYAIARGVCANARRTSARTRRRLRLVGPPAPTATPEDAAGRSAARSLVREFLAGLPAAQRRVFELADIEGMRGPEIAEALGQPLNSVYSRLRSARSRFQAFLRERGLLQEESS